MLLLSCYGIYERAFCPKVNVQLWTDHVRSRQLLAGKQISGEVLVSLFAAGRWASNSLLIHNLSPPALEFGSDDDAGAGVQVAAAA